MKLIADAEGRASDGSAAALKNALAATSGFRGWTGTVAFESGTGNRGPAPVTVDVADASGAFHVDAEWVTATGFSY